MNKNIRKIVGIIGASVVAIGIGIAGAYNLTSSESKNLDKSIEFSKTYEETNFETKITANDKILKALVSNINPDIEIVQLGC